MSLTYITKCDGCDFQQNEWAEGLQLEGWAIVQFYGRDNLNNPQRHDYCPKCWETMFCSIIKTAEQRAAQRQWQENEVAKLTGNMASASHPNG